MPTDTYAGICKRECDLCAKLLRVFVGDDGIRRHHTSIFSIAPCTAPTRDQVIERLSISLAISVGVLKSIANKTCGSQCNDPERKPHLEGTARCAKCIAVDAIKEMSNAN